MSKASKPTHEVKIEFDRRIPMRDGVTLSADVYRPGAEGRFPVILTRTPYLKSPRDKEGLDAAATSPPGATSSSSPTSAAAAIPAARFVPYVDEGRDGFDAIEWCGPEPWSTGKVATVGRLLHRQEPVARRASSSPRI